MQCSEVLGLCTMAIPVHILSMHEYMATYMYIYIHWNVRAVEQAQIAHHSEWLHYGHQAMQCNWNWPSDVGRFLLREVSLID